MGILIKFITSYPGEIPIGSFGINDTEYETMEVVDELKAINNLKEFYRKNIDGHKCDLLKDRCYLKVELDKNGTSLKYFFNDKCNAKKEIPDKIRVLKEQIACKYSTEKSSKTSYYNKYSWKIIIKPGYDGEFIKKIHDWIERNTSDCNDDYFVDVSPVFCFEWIDAKTKSLFEVSIDIYVQRKPLKPLKRILLLDKLIFEHGIHAIFLDENSNAPYCITKTPIKPNSPYLYVDGTFQLKNDDIDECVSKIVKSVDEKKKTGPDIIVVIAEVASRQPSTSNCIGYYCLSRSQFNDTNYY